MSDVSSGQTGVGRGPVAGPPARGTAGAAADLDRSRLGRAAAGRFTRPRRHGVRPTVLGSVAVAARRFAAGVARPIEVRRQLAGPGEIRPRPFEPVAQPPRWWVPDAHADVGGAQRWNPDAGATPPSLPPRGLQRAARSVPTDSSHAPGGFAGTMRGSPIPVRRMQEVTGAGSMAGAADKLIPPGARADAGGPAVAPRGDRASSPPRPPGAAAGDGIAHRPPAGAAPRSAQHGSAGVRPPGRTSLLRRAWAGRRADAGSDGGTRSGRAGTVGPERPRGTERAAPANGATGARRTPAGPTPGAPVAPRISDAVPPVAIRPPAREAAPIRRQAGGDGGAASSAAPVPPATVLPSAQPEIPPAPSSPAPAGTPGTGLGGAAAAGTPGTGLGGGAAVGGTVSALGQGSAGPPDSGRAPAPSDAAPGGPSSVAGGVPTAAPRTGVVRPGGDGTFEAGPVPAASGPAVVRRAAVAPVAGDGRAGTDTDGTRIDQGGLGSGSDARQAVSPVARPASTGSRSRRMRSPRLPAELVTGMVRRRALLGAGGGAQMPLRRAADQLPGPGPQTLASVAPASVIHPRQYGDVPRPPAGFHPGDLAETRPAAPVPGRAAPRPLAPGDQGEPGAAASGRSAGGVPTRLPAAAAQPVVRRSSSDVVTTGVTVPAPPAAGQQAATVPAAPIQPPAAARSASAPAAPTPPGSAMTAAAVASGPSSPAGGAGSSAAWAVSVAAGRDGSTGPATTPPSAATADRSSSTIPGPGYGPGIGSHGDGTAPGAASSRSAAAGFGSSGSGASAPVAGAVQALRRIPGGLLRRHAAAFTPGRWSADGGEPFGVPGSVPALPARGRSTRGPVLMRPMSAAPAGLLGGVTGAAEVVPSTTRLLASARVGAPGAAAGVAYGRRREATSGPVVAAPQGIRRAATSPVVATAAAAASGAPGAPAATSGSGAAAAPAFLSAVAGGGSPSPLVPGSAGTVRRSTAFADPGGPVGSGPAPTRPAARGGVGSRFVSAAGVPGVVRRTLRAHGRVATGAPSDQASVGAAALGPGVVGALITGPTSSPIGPVDGARPHTIGTSAAASATGGVPSAVRRTAAPQIVPAAGAILRAAMPRLAVLSLPLRTPGTATGSAGAAAAGTHGGTARAGLAATAAGLGGSAGSDALAGRPGPAPIRRTAASGPGHAGTGGPVPTRGTAETFGTAETSGTAQAFGSVPSMAGAAEGFPAAAARTANRTAAPWVSGLAGGPAVVRRTLAAAGGHRPTMGVDIRPATVDLLRSARVAPPRGMPMSATGAGPRAPASAVGGVSESVIRRPVSGRSDGGSGAAPPATGGVPAGAAAAEPVSEVRAFAAGVAADSLIRRMPAGLFERARAELRAESLRPGSAGSGVVLRRSTGGGSEPAVPTGAGTPGADIGPAPVQASLSSREWDQLVDEVVRRIEDRVATELARRGRRFTPRTL